jgi:soluble lytic murein transglycosylase-like protein
LMTVDDSACSTQLEEAWLVAQRQQVQLERAEALRQQAEDQREAADLQRHRMEANREAARQRAATERIADLVPEQYQDLVLEVAGRFGVDARLVAAVGTVESRWNPHEYGSHGDSGLMQIIPPTARWIAARLGMQAYDLYDPATNLTMGTWYLSVLYHQYGNWDAALAAYNGGPKAAAVGANYPYTRLVMKVYNQKGR